jgi:hypothetical protein
MSDRSPTGATQARPAHVWSAAAFLLGGLSLYVAWVAPPELGLAYREVLEPRWISFGYPRELVAPGKLRQTLLFLATLCFSLPLGWFVGGALLRRAATRFHGLVLAANTAVMGAFVFVFGNRHFGAVDESLAIDVGWRLLRGQEPYRDFICTLPPGFFLPPKWAFQLFGVSWSSLTLLTAAFAMATFAWQAVLLRRLLDHGAASLVAANAFQTLAILIASFWWYNPITTAAGLVYLLSALLLLRDPPRPFALVSYTAALILLASVKPNVAMLLIAGTTVVLLSSRLHRWRVALASAIAFALFVAILALNSISLSDLLRSYLSIAGRGTPSATLAFYDVNIIERTEAMVVILLALSPLLFVRWRSAAMGSRVIALFAVSAGTGLYAILAHGELKYLDTPFLALPGIVTVFSTPQTRRGARQWTMAVCLTLIATGAVLGAMRHRVERIGFGTFFEWELDRRRPQTEFFSALRTGPRFHRVAEQIEALVSEVGDARLFFGIRLEGFYAATGRESPRGLPPLLWHSNTFHPRSRDEEILDHFRRGEYDVLVFMRHDFTHFPRTLAGPLRQNYVISTDHVRRYPDLTILFLRRRYGLPAGVRPQLPGDEVAHGAGQAGVDAHPKAAVHDGVGDR